MSFFSPCDRTVLADIALPLKLFYTYRMTQTSTTMLDPSSAEQPGTISGRYLYRLFRACVEIGARQPVLLQRIGLTDRALRNPLGRLPALLVERLLACAAEELGDPAVAFRIGALFQPKSFSDLGYAHLYLSTLPDVLMRSMELQYLNQTFMRTRLERVGDTIELTLLFLNDDGPVFQHYTELQLASYLTIAGRLLGRPIRALEASLGFARPPHGDAYARHLPFPVSFGATQTRLILPASELQITLPNANHEIAQRFEDMIAPISARMLSGESMQALCYMHCMGELDKSPVTLPRVAAALGSSERTLRRRLTEEGFNFRDIVEQVRRDLCGLYLLEHRHSVGDLAALLGYSETSAFTRAFTRWNGFPPSRVFR